MKKTEQQKMRTDNQVSSDDGQWMREAMAQVVAMAGDRAALSDCVTRLQANIRFVDRLLAVCEAEAGIAPSPPTPRRVGTTASVVVRGDGRTRTGLSDREVGIVRLVVAGASPGAIAAKLAISVHTVRNHLKSCFRKMGVHTQIELVHKAIADGVAEIT